LEGLFRVLRQELKHSGRFLDLLVRAIRDSLPKDRDEEISKVNKLEDLRSLNAELHADVTQFNAVKTELQETVEKQNELIQTSSANHERANAEIRAGIAEKVAEMDWEGTLTR
jgi:hypothetical protein